MATSLLVGRGQSEAVLLPQMVNRHGLIAGATGTGKTITLQVMAERLSRIGVPVFVADIKGDLSGIAAAGQLNPKIEQRIKQLDLGTFTFAGCSAAFWDVFGQKGHPIRATVSEMGPLLISRMLDLNETQSGVLSIVFKIADDQGLLLLDLKDLRSMLQHTADHAHEFTTSYGNISPATIGTIQRGLLALEQEGADKFFGEPALDLADFIRLDSQGNGIVNVFAADRLMTSPRLYSTFLLWMLSELFENLPEVGDLEKPKLVFFFDEAHLLFNEAPKVLLEKIEQMVRLIRSKGVGVFFISQNPLDIPQTVLAQLGNRVQHALRAFTPQDQKAVKAAAQTFRSDGKVDVEKVITELAVGEALVSFLDEKGIPTCVERAFIVPPQSQIGPVADSLRQQLIHSSTVYGRYEQAIDRESAYEKLTGRADEKINKQPTSSDTTSSTGGSDFTKAAGKVATAMLQSTARAIGSQVGRQIIRGLLGSFLGGTKSRR